MGRAVRYIAAMRPVAGLRKTLNVACYCASTASGRRSDRSQLLHLLKCDRLILANAREYRETGAPDRALTWNLIDIPRLASQLRYIIGSRKRRQALE